MKYVCHECNVRVARAVVARFEAENDRERACQCPSPTRMAQGPSVIYARDCPLCGKPVSGEKITREGMNWSLGVHSEIKNGSGWQANPDGVSGRVDRGYRHWRDTR